MILSGVKTPRKYDTLRYNRQTKNLMEQQRNRARDIYIFILPRGIILIIIYYR